MQIGNIDTIVFLKKGKKLYKIYSFDQTLGKQQHQEHCITINKNTNNDDMIVVHEGEGRVTGSIPNVVDSRIVYYERARTYHLVKYKKVLPLGANSSFTVRSSKVKFLVEIEFDSVLTDDLCLRCRWRQSCRTRTAVA